MAVFNGWFALGTGVSNAGVFTECTGGSYARLAISFTGNQLAGFTQAVGQFAACTAITGVNIAYQGMFDSLTGGNCLGYWPVLSPVIATGTAFPATAVNISLYTCLQTALNLAVQGGAASYGSLIDDGAQLGLANGQPFVSANRLTIGPSGALVVHLATGVQMSSADVIGPMSVGGLLTLGYQDGLTALAGGGQTGATAILANVARVTTVASGNDSVILPACAPGTVIYVQNGAASNSMNVYPDLGAQINAVSANGAFAMAAAARIGFVRFSTTRWFTLPLVAS